MTHLPPDGAPSQSPQNPPASPVGEANRIPAAEQRRRRFAAIWLIPIIAASLTVYLGIRSYATHGPLITITFKTADGISPGQTQIKYKAVPLGTVEDVALTPDRSSVAVRVRMTTSSTPMLTDQARFWVVRPRLSVASISSLSTLVSGTYIQLDPGTPSDNDITTFTGYENPPDLIPDEAGTSYILKADELGPVNAGSAVYYRDMEVGEVISVNPGNGFDPISMDIFVRAPYDKFVRPDSRFWSASGLSIKSGASGFQVQMQSFQALMIGGVTFETPHTAMDEPQAPAKSEFVFYHNRQAADVASNAKRLPFVTYLQSSINGLMPGSPVEIYGIPVGHVSDVRLAIDPVKKEARVRIAFDIEPGQVLGNDDNGETIDYPTVMQQMVQTGMRAKIESSGLIIGQPIVSLEFVPQKDDETAAQNAKLPQENGAIVLPGESGGIDGLTGALGDVAAKLNRIPFDTIGANLNHLLASADKTVSGPDLQGAIHSLAITMANARDLSRTAKENATPALQRLPDISAQLQQAVQHANEFMGSIDNSYGAHSDFNRDAKRVLDQANDAARSIRLLADYLQRHPEALLQGKTLSNGHSGENTDAPLATYGNGNPQ